MEIFDKYIFELLNIYSQMLIHANKCSLGVPMTLILFLQ